MSRRRRSTTGMNSPGHDPGKDLFAYLFLLMVIFVFVLLMTLHQVQGQADTTNAPQVAPPHGRSKLETLAKSQFGVLEKQHGVLILRFGEQSYRPQHDIDQLLASSHLHTEMDKNGQPRKVLYLDADHGQPVLLKEYLSSFRVLSQAGIDVAFARKVN